MAQVNDRRARIAAEIRAELARQKLSQIALSNETGIKISTLRSRLDGVRPFRLEELDAIATFLQVPLAELLERTEVAA